MKKALIVSTVSRQFTLFEKGNIETLKSLGYEVHGVANYDDRSDALDDLDIYQHHIDIQRSPLSLQNIKAYFQLLKLIRKEKYDLVHCHAPMGGVLGRLAAKNAGIENILYTAHGFHFFKGAPLLNWLVFFPVEFICSFFTKVLITINKEDYHLAKRVMKARKVEYIPGIGIDIEKFKTVRVDKKAKRKELGVPENAIMILSVGELNRNKNHEVVIEALHRLNNSTIHYCIAGQGELKDYLQNKIISLGLENNVHLLGYRKDIIELCNTADIFCFPSFREGLSVSLMEAMCAGLPVVCSNIRGNIDLISKDGGYRCNPKSTNDFFVAINELVKDEDKKAYFQKNNLEAIRNFSTDLVKIRMSKIYKG